MFAAIPLAPDIRETLGGIIEKVSSPPSGVKWVERDHLHITLAFLGNQDEISLAGFFEALQVCAGATRVFRLGLGGTGAFPNLMNPKVLFVPVKEGKAEVEGLAGRVVKALGEAGVVFDDKKFHAHVTLGRVKAAGNIRQVVEKLRGSCPEELGVMEAAGLTLFKSRLTPEGPVYEPLKQFLFQP